MSRRGAWLCEPIAYGFSSIRRDPAGASSPTSVAAFDSRISPSRLYAWGVGMKNTRSFRCLTRRRKLIPQSWGPPAG